MEKPSKPLILFLNKTYTDKNLKKLFFPNPDQTKYENKVLSPEQIKQNLKRNRYRWKQNYFKKPIFFFSEYSNKTFLNYFILNLARVFSKINHTVIWSSEVSEQLFMVLRITEWQIKLIEFSECNIGNNFSRYLEKLKLKNIQVLKLREDPISNRGITQLFKLNLPHLATLELDNTDITNDIIKILEKNQGLYEQIVLLFSGNMDYHILQKNASALFELQGTSIIASRSKELELNTVYFPAFSKFNLRNFKTKVVGVQMEKNKTILEQTTLPPRTTLQILSQMISIKRF